jgi:hypothetical protein
MIARAKTAETTAVVPRAPKLNVHKLTLSATRRYDFFIPLTVEVNSQQIREIFDKVDLDHSGSITIEEMRELLHETYKNTAAEAQQTENYIQRLDVDGNGTISYEEFETFLIQMVESRNLCLREAMFLTLEDPSISISARFISMYIMVLIVISSTAFVMESMPEFNEVIGDPEDPPVPLGLFVQIEHVCIAFFTIEYVLRAITVHAVRKSALQTGDIDVFGSDTMTFHDQKEDSGMQRTWAWAWEPMNLIDFIAIFPFYLELLFDSGSGLAVFRIIRLARVFRIFKLGKYNEGMKMFGRTIAHALPALYLLFFFFILAIVLFGAMVFFAEQGKFFGPSALCPDIYGNPGANITCADEYGRGMYLRIGLDGESYEISPFNSIPASFWWVVTTATTVGYGDMYPTSDAGKLIGTCCMLAGLLVLALPITVIGSNFAGEYEKEQMREKQEKLQRREEKEANKLLAAQQKKAAKNGGQLEGALGFGDMEGALESVESGGKGKRRLSRSKSARMQRETLQEKMRKRMLEMAATEALDRSEVLLRYLSSCGSSADMVALSGLKTTHHYVGQLMGQVPVHASEVDDFQEEVDSFVLQSFAVAHQLAAEQRRQEKVDTELSVSRGDLLNLRVELAGFVEAIYKCVPKPRPKSLTTSGTASVEQS